METIRTRASEALPSVLLTLLSMVQALALELLWSHMREASHLRSLDWAAAVGWAQILAVLLGILQVWLFYTSLVMRFIWLPSLRDSVIPFGIGILEFTLIDLAGTTYTWLWFYALALIFAISVWTSHGIFQEARRHSANEEYFAEVKPATARDFRGIGLAVASLALLGTLLLFADPLGPFAFFATLFAAGLLVYQLQTLRHYWKRSMGENA